MAIGILVNGTPSSLGIEVGEDGSLGVLLHRPMRTIRPSVTHDQLITLSIPLTPEQAEAFRAFINQEGMSVSSVI